MKVKELTINGITLSVSQWKKRREMLMKGIVTGAFEKEKHKKHFEEYDAINAELRKHNIY